MRGWLVAVGLAVLAVMPYAGTLDYPFVYDDVAQVVRNDLVRSFDVRAIVAGGAVTHGHVEWYRPLTIASLALNHAWSGLDPFAYRLTNLLLHACCTLLVWAIGRRVFGRASTAAFAASLFAVHAVHAEAVTPVFGRADLLATSCVLLAWWCVLEREPSVIRLTAAAALAFAAMLAKESGAALMLAVPVADALGVAPGRFSPAAGATWWTRLRARERVYVVMVLAVGAALLLRWAAVGGLVAEGGTIRDIENPLVSAATRVRVVTAFWIIVLYLRLFLLPYPLSADYSFAAVLPATSWVDVRLLGVAALGLAAVVALRSSRAMVREPAGWVLVFVALILPVSNLIVPIGTIMAERLLYLPSVALCFAVAAALTTLLGRGESRRTWSVALLVTILVGQAALLVLRNRDWRDEETLFAATLRVVPTSAKAHVNHATVLLERDRVDEAEPLLVRALAIAPGYAEAHNLLGTIRLARRDLVAAAASFEHAVRAAPSYAPALANLGIALRQQGRLADAEGWLRRAIALDPTLATAVVNLALIQEMTGERDEAVALYRRAYELDDTLVVARDRAAALTGERER